MSSGWGTEALATHLEMPDLNRKAFEVTIVTKVEKRTSAGVSYDDFGEIIYRDDEFIGLPLILYFQINDTTRKNYVILSGIAVISYFRKSFRLLASGTIIKSKPH